MYRDYIQRVGGSWENYVFSFILSKQLYLVRVLKSGEGWRV